MQKVKSLEQLAKNISRIPKTQNVPISKILTPEFMRKFTKFSTPTEMFEKSGFEVKGAEDFEKIPRSELDSFIQKNSKFSDWSKMLGAASKAYLVKQIGF